MQRIRISISLSTMESNSEAYIVTIGTLLINVTGLPVDGTQPSHREVSVQVINFIYSNFSVFFKII